MSKNSLKILIVDDVDENIKLAAKILKDKEFNISYARSGKEALNKIVSITFDLILLDVMMPEMDGYETASKIKENQKYKEVPIIFLTAKGEIEDIVKGFSVGGVDYITKPYNSQELLARVGTHLDLYITKKELKNNLVVKDKMMSIISHDLLGPLGTIKMSLDMFLQGEFKYAQENIEEFLGNVKTSLDSSYSMMENVLSWAKNINNIEQVKLENIIIINEIIETIDILNYKLKEKNITLDLSIEEGMKVKYDKEIFHIIIRNLLSNAIKFTNNNGIIKIYAENKNDILYICVQDNGIGMKASIVETLLSENGFYTSNGVNNEKGHGLGLTMVKDFVKILGGTFEIESEPEKGSTFKFSILK